MKTLKDQINESRLQLWMIYSSDNNITYLVNAADLDDAKSLIIKTGVSETSLSGWLISNIIKKTSAPTILVDSDMIKIKGDKKY